MAKKHYKKQESEEESVEEEEQSSSEEESDASQNDSDADESEENDDEKVEIEPMNDAAEQCTFDLRNMVAINSHQLNATSLYSSKKKSRAEEEITIPQADKRLQVDEAMLLAKAQDGCAQLVGALWQLPTERSDAGPLVTLPSYFEMKIPRALPPPPPKKETKWEQFAKERGIGQNQEKRSRKVWDEASGTWMYRHGYQKANSQKEWPIMEASQDDPYADPWEQVRDAKRARVEKNMENRLRNQERAGTVTKGTAARVMKGITSTRKAGKAGGNKDRDNVLPSGVPVDLKATKTDGDISAKKRGKESTVAALIATQRSTASLGKFDQMRAGEPERKKAALKKRKVDSGTDKKVTEAERGMKVLNAVMHGGGVAREKAKRDGSLAKGETAYDFDYNDGLGASSFRKKKGRAGAGKLKKITKKRVK